MSLLKQTRALVATVVSLLIGNTETINSQSITVLEKDSVKDILRCKGTVAITNGGSGYAKGCLYIKTDVATGTSGLYQNVGTRTACVFTLVEGAEGVITGVTAGNGLAGGGTEGTVSLAVNVDDSTLEIDTDALRVKDAGITAAKLAAAVAGDGLTGGAGSALAVGAGTGLSVAADAVSIATAFLPSHVVKFVKLGSEITGTTLTGLLAGDLIVQIKVADGTVTAKLCVTPDTLVDDPADGDYLIVLRATA